MKPQTTIEHAANVAANLIESRRENLTRHMQEDDADELIQEIHLRVLQKIGRQSEKVAKARNLSAYLNTMINTAKIDYFRSLKLHDKPDLNDPEALRKHYSTATTNCKLKWQSLGSLSELDGEDEAGDPVTFEVETDGRNHRDTTKPEIECDEPSPLTPLQETIVEIWRRCDVCTDGIAELAATLDVATELATLLWNSNLDRIQIQHRISE